MQACVLFYYPKGPSGLGQARGLEPCVYALAVQGEVRSLGTRPWVSRGGASGWAPSVFL